MTCIIAIEHDEKVYMGADSSAISGSDGRYSRLEKVFILDSRFLIGYTSSFRMGQLLQYKLMPEKQQTAQDDLEYMATTFVDHVRNVLKENGYVRIENNEERGGFFLVGYKGKIYIVQSDFQINSYLDGIAVIGSGENYAYGSLYSTTKLKPMERLETAMKAAVYFNVDVMPPILTKVL